MTGPAEAIIIGLIGVSAFRKIAGLGPVWGGIWTIAMIVALDIITPPYVIGLDGVLGAALAGIFVLIFHASFAVAFAWGLGIVYALAAIFILVSIVIF